MRYWIWVIIVFVYTVIMSIVRLISYGSKQIEIANYKKIWKYYNFFEDTYEEDIYYKERNKGRWIIKKLFFHFVFVPLLSWIAVCILIYVYFSNKSFDKNLPKKVIEEAKELQFKIKHQRLSKREVILLQHKLWILINGDFNEEYYIKMRDDDVIHYLTVSKDKIHFDWSIPVSWVDNNDISQYRVEWTRVFCRTIDDWHKNDEGETTYYVKNWVSTDAPLRRNETQEKRDASVDWSEYYNMKYIPYILYNSDELSDEQLKNYYRTTIKNIKSCWKEVKELLDKNGIKLIKCYWTEDEYYAWVNEKLSGGKLKGSKKEDAFYDKLEKILEKHNCKWWELLTIKLIEHKWKNTMEPLTIGSYTKFLEDLDN